MKKIDLKKKLKNLYGVSGKSAVLVDVPTMNFLMIDGEGNPNTAQAYTDAVQALYFSADNKDIWQWTSMIMQPEWITQELVQEAREQAAKKKNLPALQSLRFQSFEEGRAAQCLHIGPYADEAPTIQRLHQFIRDQRLVLRGKHHEIYLSDPRRAAPDKLKTVIRQPA